jgi:hypothetical protein
VRKALTLLLESRRADQRLFYNEYVPLNSYYAGGIYENPTQPEEPVRPAGALGLLAEAGGRTGTPRDAW